MWKKLSISKKEFVLALRNPSIILYLASKRKAIRKLVQLEISRAQKDWTERVAQGRSLREVIELSKVHWTFQQSSLYYVCRFLKPKVVVETGVDYGASSSLILQALEDNGVGVLYSIDLPQVMYKLTPSQENYTDLSLPKGANTGFAIPSSIRVRWRLIVGDAKVELPKLLDTIGQIDFFFHDSMHTYDHMMFEYETAYPFLKSGAIIGSDDVNYNSAFDDFCNIYKLDLIRCYAKGFAVIK
jgi:predicted O-methyltransferase YrrM